MISEQKSFRKVLKPIISVVEHKAGSSVFFFFLFKKVLREKYQVPFSVVLAFCKPITRKDKWANDYGAPQVKAIFNFHFKLTLLHLTKID